MTSTPSRSGRHALEREAVLAEPRRELRVGGPEPVLVGDVEHHPTLVRLVQPPQRLEHERVAEAARRHDGPLEALDRLASGNGTPASCSTRRAAQ